MSESRRQLALDVLASLLVCDLSTQMLADQLSRCPLEVSRALDYLKKRGAVKFDGLNWGITNACRAAEESDRLRLEGER